MAPVTIVAISRARFSREGTARGAENLIQREDIPMKEKLSKQAKSVVLALSFIVWVVLGVAPVSASDLCGSTIVTDLILDQDLTCTGNGLTVGADGIKINLNGHTITDLDQRLLWSEELVLTSATASPSKEAQSETSSQACSWRTRQK